MDWAEIRSWRKGQRAALLSRRIAILQEERRRLRSVIADRVMDIVPHRSGSVIGFYWPFKGEVDLRGLVRTLIEAGARAALPVVVEKGQPLEFWEWRPRMPMGRGIWNIPIPAERAVVEPTALLVPLVGFDRDGYRLGYGGGYYDRTLAAKSPRPYAIGIGYEIGRLATIHPQPHDIPMDAIVTEAGVEAAEDEACGTFSSPPCFMHELADRGEM